MVPTRVLSWAPRGIRVLFCTLSIWLCHSWYPGCFWTGDVHHHIGKDTQVLEALCPTERHLLGGMWWGRS